MPAMPSLSAPTSIPTLLDPANFDTDSEYFWSTYWPLFSDWVTDFKSWADTNTFTDITANGYGATTLPVVPGGSIDSTSIPSGFYRTAATDTGTFPTSAETGVVMVLPRVTTSSGLYQIFMRGASAQLWVRSYVSSAWGAWSRMVTNAEIAMPQSAVVADDAATSFTPPWTGGVAFIQLSPTGANPDNARRALFLYDAGSGGASITSISTGASTTLTTGSLTGGSGVDGILTIASHTDGKIYVSNRSGGSGTLGITFMGMGTLA